MKPVTKVSTLYAIPLNEAKSYIKDYKEFMKVRYQQSSDTILKAFLVHAGELMEALGIEDVKPKHPYVRVYIGKQRGEQTADMKLFLTPVDENLEDVILEGQLSKFGPIEEYVFDLNAPCPNACDKTSQLYNA